MLGEKYKTGHKRIVKLVSVSCRPMRLSNYSVYSRHLEDGRARSKFENLNLAFESMALF